MNLKQGDLENIILNALWDLETDQAIKIYVGDVQDRIKTERYGNKEWAYTTVKTVLDRLVDKTLVLREKEGKKYYYSSVLKREEAGFMALSKLLRQYFQNDITALERCLERVRVDLPSKAGFASKPPGVVGLEGQPAQTITPAQQERIGVVI